MSFSANLGLQLLGAAWAELFLYIYIMDTYSDGDQCIKRYIDVHLYTNSAPLPCSCGIILTFI